MDFNLWIAFVVVTFTFTFIPGPNILKITSQSLRSGWKSSVLGALGISLCNLLFVLLSGFGVISLLTKFDWILKMLQYCGIIYLFYIAVKILISATKKKSEEVENGLVIKDDKKIENSFFTQGFLTHLSNPKVMIYYTVILPSFIKTKTNFTTNIVILGSTAIIIEFLVLVLYGVVTDYSRKAFKFNNVKKQEIISAIMMILIGIWLIIMVL